MGKGKLIAGVILGILSYIGLVIAIIAFSIGGA